MSAPVYIGPRGGLYTINFITGRKSYLKTPPAIGVVPIDPRVVPRPALTAAERWNQRLLAEERKMPPPLAQEQYWNNLIAEERKQSFIPAPAPAPSLTPEDAYVQYILLRRQKRQRELDAQAAAMIPRAPPQETSVYPFLQ